MEIEKTLPRWTNFLLKSLTVTLTVLLCWISFFLLTLLFVFQWLSLNWEILIMLLSQFPLFFLQTQREMPLFIEELMTVGMFGAYDYWDDWDVLHDHLRDVPLEGVFKLGASAAAIEFCEHIQVGIDVYILHHKYQVQSRSSPWLAAACAAALAHGNHFFRLYQQNKSSGSHLRLIVAKEFLKLPNQFILIKVKICYFPEAWLSQLLENC